MTGFQLYTDQCDKISVIKTFCDKTSKGFDNNILHVFIGTLKYKEILKRLLAFLVWNETRLSMSYWLSYDFYETLTVL